MPEDPAVNSLPDLAKLTTTLNRIIHTASLTIPSPNTVLKSLGLSLEEIIETAAITSEEQSSEHITMISANVRYKGLSMNFCVF